MVKMSRKSARLLARSRSSSHLDTCRTLSRKRKAEEDPEGAMEMSKRRQHYRIENQWVPISETQSITTCTILPTKDIQLSPQSSPHSSSERSATSPEFHVGSQFRFQNYFTTPVSERNSPLPTLSWANSEEVWDVMLRQEINHSRDSCVFDKHPQLQSRMRSILLDWLIEVCEVYRLHRETFYLATDFIDRFLSSQRNTQKHHLQLIGITALFIAAKLEEIYPPKMVEFAYVTDGACTEEEILDQELIILKALKWDLSPVTTNSWLNIYLQVANIENMTEAEHGFVYPQYSSHAFVNISRLLDLCVLDIEHLQFTYSVLAASALYHMSSREIALSVSGLKWSDILPCVQWMAPFAVTIRELGPVEVKFFPNLSSETAHNIQTHAVDLNLLDKAQSRKAEIIFNDRSSPDLQAQVITQLTPPQSGDKKQLTVEEQTPEGKGEYS